MVGLEIEGPEDPGRGRHSGTVSVNRVSAFLSCSFSSVSSDQIS